MNLIKICSYSLTFALMLIVISGCETRSIKYLNDSPEFSKLIGSRYELLVDCYVFRDTSDKKSNLIIGAPEMNLASFPQKISKELIGKTIDYCTFIGIIPKGSIFTLKAVRQEKTIEFTNIIFEINFPENQEFKNLNIDGMFLTTPSPRTDFIPDFVRKVSP